MNYTKALPDKLFHIENNTTRPITFFQLIKKDPTKEFLKGYLSDVSKPEIKADTQDVIAILTCQAKQQYKEPPESFSEKLQETVTTFKLNEADLNHQQKEEMAQLLYNFRHIWNIQRREGPIQHTPTVECHISTKGQPIRSKPIRTTPAEDFIIWHHIQKMAKRKVIRPSKSPWAAPILLADKKCGKIRFCVDFRRLNNVTQQDAYPLPRMDDILMALGKASYFSTMDQTEAFWSIKIRDEDIHKTAFCSKYGLWEFISMPYGLTNAPATQQRFIENILNGLLWKCCFAYVDDILCYSNSFKQHLTDIKNIFERFEKHNIQIQPSKCFFCKPNFEILGYVASKDGLKPNPKKVKAVHNYPYPASPKEIDSFLGMISWLRKFIPKCASHTVNLRQCAQTKHADFKLTKEAKAEVDLLKKLLTSSICLGHPDLDKQFYIHVDARKMGLGAILTQTNDKGNHQIIEYASKALTSVQQKYSNTLREALGVLWSLQQFKFYVHGRYPVIYCDCKCLSDLLKPGTTKVPEHVALRNWVARILHFTPRMVHKPGKMMAIPDALSRHYLTYHSQEKDPEVELLGSLVTTALQNQANTTKVLEEQHELLLNNDTLQHTFEDDLGYST